MVSELAKDIVYDRILGKFYLVRNSPVSSIKLIEADFLEYWEHISPRQIEHGFSNLTLVLTMRCNLACRYCWQTRSGCDDMEIAQIEKWVPFFLNQETATPNKIVYYGGEPLLRMDLISYAARVVRENVVRRGIPPIKQHVFTNGTLLTKSVVEFFNDEGIFPIISIDGDEDTNARYRLTVTGKSLWHRIRKGIDLLHQAGGNFGIACTVSEPSFDSDKVARFLVEEIRPKTIEFNLRHDRTILEQYARNTSPDFSSFWAAWDLSLQRGIRVIDLSKRVKPYIEGRPLENSSSGCKNKLAIMPSGRVSPFNGAVSAPELQVSDADPDWKSFFIKVWQREVRTKPECQSCEAIFICGQGSAFASYLQFGNLNQTPAYHCEYCQSVLAYIKQRLRMRVSFDQTDGDLIITTPEEITEVFL